MPYAEICSTDIPAAKRGIEHWVDRSPEQPVCLLSGRCVNPALALVLLNLMQKCQVMSLLANSSHIFYCCCLSMCPTILPHLSCFTHCEEEEGLLSCSSLLLGSYWPGALRVGCKGKLLWWEPCMTVPPQRCDGMDIS